MPVLTTVEFWRCFSTLHNLCDLEKSVDIGRSIWDTLVPKAYNWDSLTHICRIGCQYGCSDTFGCNTRLKRTGPIL